jgi:hypothetical protein
MFEKLKKYAIKLWRRISKRSRAPVRTPASKVPKRKRQKRKPATSDPHLSSLGEVLINVDQVFKDYLATWDSYSWIDKKNAKGLRKIGTHVSSHEISNAIRGKMKANKEALDKIFSKENFANLPTIGVVSFGDSVGDQEDDYRRSPTLSFFIREHKLPHYVDKCNGVHYLFGLAYRGPKQLMKEDEDKLFWCAGYVTIRPSKGLYLHKELHPKLRTIPTHPRRNGKKDRTMKSRRGHSHSYVAKEWNQAQIATELVSGDPENKNILNDEEHDIVKGLLFDFQESVLVWMDRNNHWSVSIFKNKDKLTMAVPYKQTKRFFKDRVKVKNDNGQTKRIIHHVQEHDRQVSEGKVVRVKEHIRGLADFQWRSYRCHVTAPKFNGLLSSQLTGIETVDEDEVKPNDMRNWINAVQLGNRLNTLEDGGKDGFLELKKSGTIGG